MENKIVRRIEINGTTYDVPTIDGFDFSALGWSEKSNEAFNQFVSNEISKARKKATQWNEESTGHSSMPFWSYYYNTDESYLLYAKLKATKLQSLYGIFNNSLFSYIDIDDALENSTNLETCSVAFQKNYNLQVVKFGKNNHFSKVTNVSGMFEDAYSLRNVEWGNLVEAPLIDMSYMFKNGASKMQVIDLSQLQTRNVTNMNHMFFISVSPKFITKRILGLDMYSCTNASNIVQGRTTITDFECINWRLCDLPLNQLSLLTPQSINRNIKYASGVEDGAVARTLYLHATAKANWSNPELNPDYEYYQAMAYDKLITIA